MRFAAVAMTAVLVLGAAACGGRDANELGPDNKVVTVYFTEVPPPDRASRADVTRWVATWCSLNVGIATSEAKRLMGRPSEDYKDPEPAEVLMWLGRGYAFIAQAQNGRITLLHDNGGTTNAVPALPCPTIRQ
jgi:hypothetical protein